MTGSNNKTALITGATSGIGAVFAEKFAARGYDLIITGRRKDIIEKTADDLRTNYNTGVTVKLSELSDNKDIESLVSTIKNTENLEVLINNAGFGKKNNFLEEDITTHENMLKVHCLATMKLTYAALPLMIKNKKGTIINVSSLAAFFPLPKSPVYSATKSFINIFSESIHIELKGTGVRIQALCPGMTRTDFHTRIGMDESEVYKDKGMAKAMTPEEVVDISLNCLEKNKVICIPGSNNKFISILPRILTKSQIYKILQKKASASKKR
ncbi:SDR family oxidoreductase [bacterium]|nr:SDR family oxidoreductase [bacterium]